jgi:predicted lipoprotein with Yx(FWY)xxD motif
MKQMILAPLTGIVLAACGQVSAASTPTPSSPPSGVAIDVATSPTLGEILTTSSGRTLYYFTPERGGTIVCTGPCAQIWHPLLTPSGLLTTTATLPGTLATVSRPEGRQVTYSEWPLYTFSGDKAAGDTSGQGILGKWFVATTTLTDAPIATSTPTPSVATVAPTQAPMATPPPAPYHPTAAPAPTSCIPGMNGGDHDGDNNGGPSDLDGCR